MRPLFFFSVLNVFFLLGAGVNSFAQVCTGSLGDPVVNVNFGRGANPGNQLQAATTTYNFTSSTCPNDGSYTVVNNTAGCFGNSWHTVPEDHTPNDTDGYMMLVNASFTPGDFYVDTVKGLCANTTYEFAAWIINVLLPSSCSPSPISPKLVFSIETISGTVLGTYSTGDLFSSGSPTWKQYGLFFKTPVNTSTVLIRLTNTAPGGCGNDLALDDITFRPCGTPISTFVETSNKTTADLCIGSISTLPIKATMGTGFNAPSLQWQESTDNEITWTDIAGANFLTYLFNKTAVGVYKYRLTAAEGTNIAVNNCRVASNIVVITIHGFPAVTATGNSPVCEKQLITLNATGGATYAWTGPAGFNSLSSGPVLVAKNNSAGQYRVIATDEFGCSNAASVTIVTNPKPSATISSAQSFCEGKSVALLAGGGLAYLWSPALGLSAVNIPNPIASPLDSTLYSVVVTSANNCTDTPTVMLNVLKKPTANAGVDKVLLKGQSTVLNATAGGSAIRLSWAPGTFLDNPLVLQPLANPLSDYRYTLTVTSNAGCGVATDEVFVKVYNDIYVPTAFSPNNDNLNDEWRIETLVAVPNATVKVFNRFGKIIFATTGINEQWDGTYKGQQLAAGAYAYMIDLKNGRPLIKGMVMLVR